jgi:dephospho-CoA kinase
MYQVGITGGIGSGKTLVCSVLESLGVEVYYADREARRLMNDHGMLKGAIIELLGSRAYSGELDRQYVASRVFGNRELLEKLNSLVHPVVREDYRNWVKERPEGMPYVVEEAAILLESGASRFLDETVLVYAPSELRIRRVMERDGVSREEVERRMMHQMDEEEKRVLADRVLVNDDREMLLPGVVALHQDILIKTKSL